MESTLKSLIHDFLQVDDLEIKVERINEIRELIHSYSPFKNEPVDFVKWVINQDVTANDYNPNKVAPPEMELLEVSIMNDGYTQPIVTWRNEEKHKVEVIDGFHRNRVGKESEIVRQRVQGYLPIVSIRSEQTGKNDRIASTIRHNRARGKHQINAMSEIVIELKNRNWANNRIARELGMDEEEVLRLCQISGLENIFSDNDFSKAWESSDSITNEYEVISDEISESEYEMYRIPNESDSERIFHTFDKWECYKAGFYASTKEGMTSDECENKYLEILSDLDKFRTGLDGVISDWVYSCEHYLTNKAMNRIAWLGQAAVCYLSGVPSKYCAGWNLLSEEQKNNANLLALEYLNKWRTNNGKGEIDLVEALSIGRQVELY